MNKINKENNFWEKIATFIVDKRNGFFLIFGLLLIFSIFSSKWVVVNDNLIDYLPKDTETRIGIDTMDREFTTYDSADIMIANITFKEADSLLEDLRNIEGVASVDFDNNKDHYKSSSALFKVTFKGENADEVSKEAMEEIKSQLSEYDLYISSEVDSSIAALLDEEMRLVIIVAVVIIVLVLLFTSKSYLEIPVLLITFGAAALLNVGSNFILGEISFISDSVAIILQLALAIDYAIILSHRYSEEREQLESREAVIQALSKAIPEISSSSLTTISSLIALTFMQFQIGFDMGIVLVKAIILSLASVFLLMPGLLMVFSEAIDRTKHRNFVPSIKDFGKLVIKTRYIVPPIFVVLLIFGFFFSNKVEYSYGYSELTTIKKNSEQISAKMIKDNFGKTNLMALLVPTGNYEKEKLLIKELEALEITESVTGLANIEIDDDYVITDSLTARQFSELLDLDIELAEILYRAHAISEESYGNMVNNSDNYAIPLIDTFFFINKEKFSGLVTLDEDIKKDLDDMYSQLEDAKLQLKGENYSRILLETNLAEEGEETFGWLDKIHNITDNYYSKDSILVGESTNNRDLHRFFQRDNKVIGIASAVFVMIILLFAFQSGGLPVLLMMTIQGSIWINFSISGLMDTNVFFITYLIVSSIQMGANIDYAIIITGRFQELKQTMPVSEAIVEALDQAFPTIITSGSILASAGLLIGFLSSEPSISSIGLFLGRGTIISLVIVMGILPQILLLGNKLIDRTGFKFKERSKSEKQSGSISLDGHIQGHISGIIDAEIKGDLLGDIDAQIKTSSRNTKEDEIHENK